MSHHGPISDEKKQAIADAIAAPDGPPSFAELCARFLCSRDTIVRVAESIGMRDAWEHRRAQTEAATAHRAAAVAAHRQELELESLTAAREILARRFDSHPVVVKTVTGSEIEDVDNGPEDWRNIGQAVNGLTNSAIQLARLETDLAGAGQASGILDDIEIGLREARLRREAESRVGEV